MQIVFLLYEQMTALDLVGPHEILSRLPKAEVKRVAKKKGQISSDSGLVLTAEHSLEEASYADVLVIPGAGNATSFYKERDILDWVRSIHTKTLWTTSVCTGSLILGAAGILSGLRATTHWAALDRLQTWGAQPVEARVVEDGKVMTAAGVSAGIDMALLLTAKIAGPSFAQAMQLGIEYSPEPPFSLDVIRKTDPELCKNLRESMQALFEKEKYKLFSKSGCRPKRAFL